MSVQPTQITLTPDRELVIDWDDGQCRRYAVADLRAQCPCAACQGHGPRSPAWSPPAIEPDLTIRFMDPVGNYAYRILFSDGHDTGIYTLDLLRRLGKSVDGPRAL